MLKVKQGVENAIRITTNAAAVKTAGMTMTVSFAGVDKTFSDLANGRRFTFWLTAAESASLTVGDKVGMDIKLKDSSGNVFQSFWQPFVVVPSEWEVLPDERKIYLTVVVPNAHALDGLQYLTFPSQSAFPANGQSGMFYLASDTNMLYVWTGSGYSAVSGGGGGGGEIGPVDDITFKTSSPNVNYILDVSDEGQLDLYRQEISG